MKFYCVLLVSLFHFVFDAGAVETLGENERRITLIQTNDIHGGIEAEINSKGTVVGGMAFFTGVVNAIRDGLRRDYLDKAGLVLVDGGDQFQGTLISNFDEGLGMIQAMNAAGYDAAVPGNHDFDFGPLGWLTDQVEAEGDKSKSREAFEKCIEAAKFPFVSSNIFYRDNLSKAWDPVEPYTIKKIADVRVAIIGLDNPATPTTTTAANVEDLFFGAELDNYLRIRNKLEGKVDLFVLLIHDGNIGTDRNLTNLVKSINSQEKLVDIVASGHTHTSDLDWVGDVPIIQSGAGGTRFGRIDLVYNLLDKKIKAGSIKALNGIWLNHTFCDQRAVEMCKVEGEKVFYDGVEVVPDPEVVTLVNTLKSKVEGIATQKLGNLPTALSRHRYQENLMGNVLSDLLREVAKTPVAVVNAGGVRTDLQAGELTYEEFFKVLPFNNHGVIVSPMSAATLVALIQKSIKSCGQWGGLSLSGVQVVYDSSCVGNNTSNPKAVLKSVTLQGGQKIYDEVEKFLVPESWTVDVATLDFLAAGGSGYSDFTTVPISSDLGIVREEIVKVLLSAPYAFPQSTDGRYQNLNPAP